MFDVFLMEYILALSCELETKILTITLMKWLHWYEKHI